MKKRFLFLLFEVVVLTIKSSYVSATTYYVSAAGTTSASGTISTPLNISTAIG